MSIEKFTSKADQYAKGRPSYPAAAVDYLKTLVNDDVIIADIGAGTGKFTELIAQAGYEVFAVEPNPDMYAQLQLTLAEYQNAKPIFATSEETTLADSNVDIITVAQALHWFDLEKFEAECKRILKPDGWVIALYNNVISKVDHQIVLHDNDGKEISRQAPYKKKSTDEFFTNPVEKEFTNLITYTRESWFAFMMSHSHSPLPSDENYHKYVEKINAIFDCENKEDLLHREVITTVYAEQLN